MGVIAAAVVAAGAAAYGAYESGQQAEEANDINASNARSTERRNRQFFLESRGMGLGNSGVPGDISSLFPFYANEEDLGADTLAYYQAARNAAGTPEQEYRRYQDIVGRYNPLIAQGDRSLEDIFSGVTTDQELANAQPVFAARNALAQGQQEGIFEGLSARLNALDAQRATQGFVGTGSFDRNRAIASTIMARQAASGVRGEANLANASQTFGIQQGGINRRIAALDAPFQRAQLAGQFAQAPGQMYANAFNARRQPFEFFRMGPQTFRTVPPPQVQPEVSMGQVVAAGVGSLAGSYGTYAGNQQLMNGMQNSNWNQQAFSRYGYPGPNGYPAQNPYPNQYGDPNQYSFSGPWA